MANFLINYKWKVETLEDRFNNAYGCLLQVFENNCADPAQNDVLLKNICRFKCDTLEDCIITLNPDMGVGEVCELFLKKAGLVVKVLSPVDRLEVDDKTTRLAEVKHPRSQAMSDGLDELMAGCVAKEIENGIERYNIRFASVISELQDKSNTFSDAIGNDCFDKTIGFLNTLAEGQRASTSKAQNFQFKSAVLDAWKGNSLAVISSTLALLASTPGLADIAPILAFIGAVLALGNSVKNAIQDYKQSKDGK